MKAIEDFTDMFSGYPKQLIRILLYLSIFVLAFIIGQGIRYITYGG